MKRLILFILVCMYIVQAFAQQGQLSISRIDQMPNVPSPLQIRDWDAVARDYDNLVFDLNKTGAYLPLSAIGLQGQYNYADNTPVFQDSYVGADNHLKQAEAINILPAVVGASLVGVDKSNQNGHNWVVMTKDFFNLKNGQNVYLNSYSTQSGHDWWYDVMPNVYFYQLKSLYPNAVSQFNTQFTDVADQWLKAVELLGGSTSPWKVPNMNYRAFNLATGKPLSGSVAEPESAGSIAWLLYNAYLQTGKRSYKDGAQLSMDFLTSLTSNPSYELQLPYGTLIAARMNAVEDTSYPLDKLLSWCFDRGPLRGWGSIVGTWNGYPVSGLIGEANDNGNDYAFVMNGFQQAAALAPLPKYDKRYAKAIAKWLLNVTNASRLFYRDGLPAENQDSYEWSAANDPNAVIPHEALRQTLQGKSPFATGDAIKGGWAASNLSLYSGSSVGYLAAVSQTTNVAEILQIDLNKTDFYGQNTFPSYLYFNPTAASQNVTVPVQFGPVAVYDAITESTLTASATNAYDLTIPAGEVRLLRLYASNVVPQERNGQLYAGDAVLDYHYKYDFVSDIRIKSLSVSSNPVVAGAAFTAYSEPGNVNPGDAVQYEWFLNDTPVEGQQQVTFTAPSSTGRAILKSRISLNGKTAEDTLQLKVVEKVAVPPVVTDISSTSDYTQAGGNNTFTVVITPTPGEILTYAWSVNAGTLQSSTSNSVVWQAPSIPGIDTIKVIVSNQELQATTFKKAVLVKASGVVEQQPLIWYPFDTDVRNAIADKFHATVTGASKTEDARGKADLAYHFTSGQQIISTANAPELNFTDALTVSCWIKADQFGAERYIISHGSWQQRFKLSILPEGKLRWTVKTDKKVEDLDSKTVIELNRYYHVTGVYTGYSLELYIDGKLDAFKPFSGKILASTHPLTIGRQDEVEIQYSMMGSIDEVKIWDKEIPVTQIEKLKDQWFVPVGIEDLETSLRIYPNPARDFLILEFSGSERPVKVILYAPDGKKIYDYLVNTSESTLKLKMPQSSERIYILQIMMKNGNVVTRKIAGM